MGGVREGFVKHYRVKKLAKPKGEVVKVKHMLANNDRQAIETARADEDCPICDVFVEDKKIGSIV